MKLLFKKQSTIFRDVQISTINEQQSTNNKQQSTNNNQPHKAQTVNCSPLTKSHVATRTPFDIFLCVIYEGEIQFQF